MRIRIRCYADPDPGSASASMRIRIDITQLNSMVDMLQGQMMAKETYCSLLFLSCFFSNICWIRKYPYFRPPREYLFTVLPPPLATQEKHQHPPGICCPTTNIMFSFSLLLLQQKRLCDVQLLLWPYCMAIYFCLSFLFSFLYLFTASAYTM